MKNFKTYFFGIGSVLSVLSTVWGAEKPAGLFSENFAEPAAMVVDSDSLNLRYPFHDRMGDPYSNPGSGNPLYLKDPANIKTTVDYDPDNNRYNINENMGELFYRNPSYMSFEEFVDHEFNKSTKEYWKQRASEDDQLNKKAFAPKITVNSIVFDRIFGGNTIDIRPQGSAELSFAINVSKNQNPALPEKQRTVTTFDFKEKIQMNVIANIGDKMKLTTNYNTEATFDFENKMKLEYTGYEDDIIKKIEAGNVSLPLNSQLIQGSQSLFGIKTQLQFGRMTVTSIFSQQKGKSQTIDVQGGAQTTTFDIKADQYEDNRHFFIAQYFKDNYDANLRDLNRIGSGINITRIEVWVTPKGFISSQNNQNRNIVAFADLGEYMPDTNQTLIPFPGSLQEPSDSSNSLFAPGVLGQYRNTFRDISQASSILSGLGASNNFNEGRNWEKVENARLLQPSEYTVNSRLGYVSLNTKLDPGQVLAVAFEYSVGGRVHQVGELTNNTTASGAGAIYVKLLRSTNFTPKFYTWDLMMKNIYSLGGYNIAQKDFRLDVLYQDDRLGGNINYLQDGCENVKGVPLLRLLNLDDLNTNGDPQPDGMFDFVGGITINAQTGRIIFPVREPFGSYLANKCAGDADFANQYAYYALYDSTKTAAQQQPEKNKFTLHGTYQSSSGSDIPLNAVNVPQGSVKVTAGGVPLTENVDYTVDYTLGRVKIINDGILKSNTPIKISLESNSLFNLQTKTMMGSRFDYVFNKDFQIGGTILHLSERPLTQKVNIGDEPISNTVWGVDGNYRTDSRFITKLLDKLPLYNTKETSSITLSGEFAQLVPGHSKAVGKAGTSYVDDFEGAITPLDLKNPGSWFLASLPLGQEEEGMFLEGKFADNLAYGFNRARTAWYYVDPLFQRNQPGITPSDIDANDQSNNFVRDIPQAEIFPNKSQPNGPQSITCMNMAFYPNERGPYNYDVDATVDTATGLPLSSGVNIDGTLKDPSTRWGGIMRKIETSDFEASNIEFIQFWMMDPFADGSPNNGTGGDLFLNLGSLSEDILRDGHKSFENGLPAPTNNYTTASSTWGRYPTIQSIVNAFDNDPASRTAQDVGLDGLIDADEQNFFGTTFLDKIRNKFGGTNNGAYTSVAGDPSSDDYSYFLNPDYSTNNVSPLDRYKRYNGQEGNSPANGTINGVQSTATTLPDAEDINRDNNMETGEDYYQYQIDLRPGSMVVGQNYITDEIESTVRFANNTNGSIKWYQFKIPIRSPEKAIGEVDLTNIRFVRMFMKNFETPVVCRFAKLEFLRGEWRRYNYSLLQPGEYSPTPEVPGNTQFDLASVSIEENGSRQPVPYVLPPGIDKERDISTTQLATLNEQSLSLRVCDLADGDARAAYRNTQLDIRAYKKLKMFIHAESRGANDALQNGDLHAFVRLGSDFNDNYYEYEIPLVITPWNSTGATEIWPEANNMEIELEKLIDAKLRRNNAMQVLNNVTLQTPYFVTDGDRIITVKGTPNLSNIRSIMIGVRNPKDPGGNGPKICAEVWVNELRMSDFDEKGGWAATARVTAKLADLGTMSLVGNHSTSGWGSIEKKVSERDKADKSSYDFSTTLELGKFIPEKAGIKLPMYFGYSESFINPQYNPLDPDVLLTKALDASPNTETKDSIKKQVIDYTQRKSLNFTNVRKTKTGNSQKSRIYDVENLNFTYAYTEIYQRNYNISYSLSKSYQGVLGYNYNHASKPIVPFEKSPNPIIQSKWGRLIKDFNFNPVPSGLNFRTSLDRTYSETQLRNNSGFAFQIDPTYIKTYTMTRNYGLNWDLTRSIKLDFNADANAMIDEPAGRLDTREERDSVKENLKRLGRLTRYHHAANVTYNLPLNKIPAADWIASNVRYGSDYSWQASPLYRDTIDDRIKDNPWGNTLQNSQTIAVNANFTMTTLYNKIPYFKKINQNTPAKGAERNKPKVKLPTDSLGGKKDSTRISRPSPLEPVFKGIANLIMMVKTASVTYQETNGTMLPGFRGTPDWVGQDWNFNGGKGAPGWGFLFGSQKDPRPEAIQNNWLTKDTTLNSFFTTTKLQNLTLRASVEPIKNLKIELSGNRNYTLSHNEYFRAGADGKFSSYGPTETGNFSISYLTWSTHFVNDAKDYSNKNFEDFKTNLLQISNILSAENPNTPSTVDSLGFHTGYGKTQQEVLTYAFLSAYSGKSPDKKIINRFPKIPKPNWRITYDGLSKLKFFQSFLQSFSLSHGYRSTYSINSFSQNLLYEGDPSENSIRRDTLGNFIPKYDIQQITIAEQLSPLIGIDMTWKNSLQTRFEIKRDRTLTLAYSNIQVTEVRGIEYVVGLGYKFKKVTLPFKVGGNKKLSNDLTVKADFSMRKNTTILRKLVEGTNQPSSGSTTLGVKLSADYPLNDRFNIRAFYEYNSNNPFVSSSYPTSNTNAGLSIRFTLAQ
ncbi:MAG: cell surface protein SprA [Bacteroidetes bacterium]|nr:cell surface protein SprA [Bacteroidota bacterium]